MYHVEQRRRLFKLQQALGSFYIGIASTSEPKGKISRWDRHKNKYDAMFVIATITAQSTSTSMGDDDVRVWIRELEEYVINQYKDRDARCDNKNKGGGGNDSKEQPIQILYVCIKLNPIHDHAENEYPSKLTGERISYHIAVMKLIKKIDEITHTSPKDRKLKSFSIGFIHTDTLNYCETSEMESTATSLVQIYKLCEITNWCLPKVVVAEGVKVDRSKLKEEYALTLVHSLATHYRFSDHSCPEFEYKNELIEEYNPGEHESVIFLYTQREIKNPSTPASKSDRSARATSAPPKAWES